MENSYGSFTSETNQINSKEREGSKKNLQKIFYLLFITNLLINLDHGIIPAASLQIEESLEINNDQLGILGSLVYAGIVVIGVIAGPIFMKFNPKVIIQISMVAMMASLLFFTFQFNANYPYFIIRFLTGVSQAPLLVYFPVWVDNFGGSRKTIWLSLLQGGVPFGVFLGYVLSSFISQQWGWQKSFFLQIIVMAPCFVGFFFIKKENFDIRNRIKDKITQETPEGMDQLVQIQNGVQNRKPPSYFKLLKILFKSIIYINVMISLVILFFTVTGIQFWMSNYMEKVLHEPQKKVNTVFSVISITAPTFGCLAGGMITQYLGGYESKHALTFCFIFALIGCSASAPVPFISNFWTISVLVWLLLFFGGSLVPPLTGIMISSVRPNLRSFANSNTTTFINLFGYLPAPSVYGLLSQVNEKLGIQFLMIYPSFALFFLGYALVFQLKKNKQSKIRVNLKEPVSEETKSTDSHFEEVSGGQYKQIGSIQKGKSVEYERTPKIRHRKSSLPDREEDISYQVFQYHTVLINPVIPTNFQKEQIIQIRDDILQNENQSEFEEIIEKFDENEQQ